MRRKCLNPGCVEFFTPGKENRGYGGCCSLDCFRIAQRGYSSGAGLTLMPVPSVSKAIEQSVSQKPLVQRRPAKQNWRSSNE
jgi:hypothetical protein